MANVSKSFTNDVWRGDRKRRVLRVIRISGTGASRIGDQYNVWEGNDFLGRIVNAGKNRWILLEGKSLTQVSHSQGFLGTIEDAAWSLAPIADDL